MKPDLKSLKFMKPDLDALKFGLKPLKYFISFKFLKILGTPEVRPKILEILITGYKLQKSNLPLYPTPCFGYAGDTGGERNLVMSLKINLSTTIPMKRSRRELY